MLDEYTNKARVLGRFVNYHFDPLNGLGEFSRFEKELHLNLPDKFFLGGAQLDLRQVLNGHVPLKSVECG